MQEIFLQFVAELAHADFQQLSSQHLVAELQGWATSVPPSAMAAVMWLWQGQSSWQPRQPAVPRDLSHTPPAGGVQSPWMGVSGGQASDPAQSRASDEPESTPFMVQQPAHTTLAITLIDGNAA